MRRISSILLLEFWAVVLALRQSELGVRTDEAKYLLDIPYPHPPLVRWMLSLFDGFPWQEFAVRLLFATIVIQTVWLLWNIGRGLRANDRIILAGSWLLAWGAVSQAGAIMMAPLTAVQGLAFIWLLLRGKNNTAYAGLISLFWLASLFTAYQAALFLPLVAAIFWEMKLPLRQRVSLFLIPIAILGLYTFTNPLALASIVGQAGKDAGLPPLARFGSALTLWFAAGSGVLSLAGTYGLIRSKNIPLIASFLLVFAYVFAGYHDYYVVLFVPFLAAGLFFFLQKHASVFFWYMPLLLIGFIASVTTQYPYADIGRPHFYTPLAPASPAREVLHSIEARGTEGDILIQGSFGHEWQYESTFSVRRYAEALLPDAQAVVCLDRCDQEALKEFTLLMIDPAEVFVRK